MKAIAVFPGKPNSVHLADLPKPSVDEIPGGRGVLVKVLRVGVDGTDKEINAAEYGAAPPGYDVLVVGHEGFGRVEAVGQIAHPVWRRAMAPRLRLQRAAGSGDRIGMLSPQRSCQSQASFCHQG